ncbi:PfaD family polyunsaturated fatty acid/polyketide biosynthesis protein [Streptomyces sp. NPDC059894]|uniref:PfaD family polyunsaturated fatty acid/polyketide biosynthesis protein n=1 Tax=unclassified Streptomyces TaxID=2593676 RepID=UPI0036699507
MTAPVRTGDGVARDPRRIHRELLRLDRPCFVIRDDSGVGVTVDPELARRTRVLASVPPLPPESLGDREFLAAHGVRQAYAAGAMAGGIASADLVTALSRAGYLASFGAGGVVPDKIDQALTRIRRQTPGTPFACNLIHSPSEPAMERAAVRLFLHHRVRCVEASAFMDLTPQIVHYRAAGLVREDDGSVRAEHRLIAKVSRAEVAERFLRPAPADLLRGLVQDGSITAGQAELAARTPMADDITAEADSGGHTDRRPLVVLLPELIALRDRVQRELGNPRQVRIGAAGGIGTPAAAATAFGLGAAYVVTGSVNQSCVEADQSPAAKELLAAAGTSDCVMAPSADMFELGVHVQVLQRGTMFAGRARRLYELYRAHDSIESLPDDDRRELEKRVFQRPLSDVWQDCVRFFAERDPAQIRHAEDNPKRRMALIFRWYLGRSSGWSVQGAPERAADYQIWCGPAMGAFNQWVTGTYLATPANRGVVDVATHLMRGAAYTSRVHQLRLAGVRLPAECATYLPAPPATRGGDQR